MLGVFSSNGIPFVENKGGKKYTIFTFNDAETLYCINYMSFSGITIKMVGEQYWIMNSCSHWKNTWIVGESVIRFFSSPQEFPLYLPFAMHQTGITVTATAAIEIGQKGKNWVSSYLTYISSSSRNKGHTAKRQKFFIEYSMIILYEPVL